MAILDEKKTARTASEFKVLLCISFNSNNEAIIEKVIVVSNGKKSRNTPIAIPANAKCDNVSPTSEILLETTNIPNIGAVIDSNTLPINARTIKSWEKISNIFNHGLDGKERQRHIHRLQLDVCY